MSTESDGGNKMGKVSVWALVLAFVAAFASCTSPPPTYTVQQVTSGTGQQTNAPRPNTQQATKATHDCVESELAQSYVVETVRLTFDDGSDTYLHYCFVSGYHGIECEDDWDITRAVGHGLSNRERAKCDVIMRRLERHEAAEEARKKKQDAEYDKRHHLTPEK